jgi:ABC-2 type transport system ATP-binding protein
MTHTSITAETVRPVEGLDAIAGVQVLGASDGQVRLEVEPAQLDEVVGRLAGAGLRSLVSNPPTLEELFLREYGDELAHEAAHVDEEKAR